MDVDAESPEMSPVTPEAGIQRAGRDSHRHPPEARPGWAEAVLRGATPVTSHMSGYLYDGPTMLALPQAPPQRRSCGSTGTCLTAQLAMTGLASNSGLWDFKAVMV